MKKGISLVVLVLTIIIMIILAGVAVFNISGTLENTDKTKLKADISELQNLINTYKIRKSGVIDFEITTFNTEALSEDELKQFEGESIVNNSIILYVIDLNKIDAEEVNFGNLQNGNDDRYLYSNVTGKVYYEKGLQIGEKTYYHLLKGDN